MGGGTSDGGSFNRVLDTKPTDREGLLFDTYPMSQGDREFMRKESFDSGYAAGYAEGRSSLKKLRRLTQFSIIASLLAIGISIADTKEVTRVVIYYPANYNQSQIDSMRQTYTARVKWYQWVDMEPNDQH